MHLKILAAKIVAILSRPQGVKNWGSYSPSRVRSLSSASDVQYCEIFIPETLSRYAHTRNISKILLSSAVITWSNLPCYYIRASYGVYCDDFSNGTALYSDTHRTKFLVLAQGLPYLCTFCPASTSYYNQKYLPPLIFLEVIPHIGHIFSKLMQFLKNTFNIFINILI